MNSTELIRRLTKLRSKHGEHEVIFGHGIEEGDLLETVEYNDDDGVKAIEKEYVGRVKD